MKKYPNAKRHLVTVLGSCFLLMACQSDNDSTVETIVDENMEDTVVEESTGTTVNGVLSSDGSFDIYNAIFTNRSVDCGDYVNEYDANPTDLQNALPFNADVLISVTDSTCTISSNSVPNHDFNDDTAAFSGGAAGATISPQESFAHTITRTPGFAPSPTFISQAVKNGIFLNGVRLDILSAGCYRPTDAQADESGEIAIGCSSDSAWLLDPLSTESKFGADLHNAHTQPGGLYHYHGSPVAMFDDNPGPDGSPVIGFAADGFPIYGPYFFDEASGAVRKAVSGYTLKSGSRGERSDTNPGGEYTGRYNDDWEFTDAGDLDECNGMTVDGQYGYYVTDSYPWVIKCLMGTPDDSFVQADGGPDGPPGDDLAQGSFFVPHAH